MDIKKHVLISELRSVISESFSIIGEPNVLIGGFSPIDNCGFGDLTFAVGEYGTKRVFYTTAMVVITTPDIYNMYDLPSDKTYLLVKNPRLAFIECLNHFIPPNEPYIHKGKNVKINPVCIIGNDGFGFERKPNGELIRFPSYGGVYIGDDVEIGSNVCIDRGTFGNTIIGKGTKIDNLVHISHNAQIGENCLIVAGCVVGGSAKIGNNCWLGLNSSIRDGCKVGNGAFIGMGAVVVKDVPDGEVVVGNPARKLIK